MQWLVRTSDFDCHRCFRGGRSRAWCRCHSALGKSFWLTRAITGGLRFIWRGSRGCGSNGNLAIFHWSSGRLRRRFVRVGRGRRRRNVRKRRTCRHVGVENKFLDSHNLLPVAVFLQLAEQWLDLVKEGILLSTLKLTKDFFYRKVSKPWF